MARGKAGESRSGAKTVIQGATTGYEAELWRMADTLRGSMDAAEYKHVVLGLIFLKYISDAFEEVHARLEGEQDQGADPEDPDEYRAENIFWVPPEARWTHLKAQARQPVIGQLVDDAMAGIERDNPALKDVLPKDYARPALDKQRLGQLIDLISNIKVGDELIRFQRHSGPVEADETEESVVNGIPLGSPWRIVADGDRQPIALRQSFMETILPQMGMGPVAAAIVAQHQQLSHVRMMKPAIGSQPGLDGVDGEFGGVVGGANDDRAGIHLKVVDAVRQGHAKRLRAEIVGEHLRRQPAPGLSGVEEQTHQLTFLAVDADDGLAPILKLCLDGAQMAKLLVALRMTGLSDAFAVALQREVESLEAGGHRVRASSHPFRGQRLAHGARALPRPLQPGHGVAGRVVDQQRLDSAHEFF